MKCINKGIVLFLCTISLLLASGCGTGSFDMAYDLNNPVSSFRADTVAAKEGKASPFAADLCVVDGNLTNDEQVDMSAASAAALFNVDSTETLYAKNVYDKLYPASLTKVMTALVALKYGSADSILTASSNVKITESGAQVCGLKEGDTMTLDQALHILLIYSANDVAVMIAENIGGSVEGFCEMMNQEAKAIGATNSNFMNPNGLQDDNHYVTVYDMYLIFNEAIKYDLFNEIIHMDSYDTVYYDAGGNSKDISVSSTNLFLQGDVSAPNSITVIGGKTGTTNAAGHCLVLLSRDTSGNSYISIILRSEGRDILYTEMSQLLGEIKQ